MANAIRHLLYENVAPGKPYHAALIAMDGASARGFQVTEHTHDFYELMYVLAGEAAHAVNERAATLRQGDLVLLRADRDRHAVRFRAGRPLHYVNIAFPSALWASFRDLSGIGDRADAAEDPPTASLAQGRHDECAAAFRSALDRFRRGPASDSALRLELCALLALVGRTLTETGMGEGGSDGFPDDTPPWLVRACGALRRDPDALRAGLPRLVEEAGVTRTHLARVLKAATGRTPTEYVNELRLARAAHLLNTTTLSILDVAGECGFEQPSYFYRLFRARYGAPPHAYRVAARRSVAPGSR